MARRSKRKEDQERFFETLEALGEMALAMRTNPEFLASAFDLEKSKSVKDTKAATEVKSLFIDPYAFYATSAGMWRERPTNITFDTLRVMAERNPIVAAIINTRINQVATFSSPVRYAEITSNSPIGYKIVPKQKDKKLSKGEQKFVEEIEDWFWACGNPDIKSIYDRDNYDAWLRKITRDSLTFDGTATELVPTRKGGIYEFHPIDTATIRVATIRQDTEQDDDVVFVQVLNGQVVARYAPDEIMYGIRNPTTNVRNNGYGVSELEQLISVITNIFNAMAHNSNFFKNGASVKGILNIKPSAKGGGVMQDQLEAFKRAFYAMATGSANSWKMPITQADDMQFIDMGKTNREQEFSRYLDFLTKLACFPAGTTVLMADGTRKPIENVVPGDEVVTHLGRIKKVTDIMKRHYNGDMIRVKSRLGIEVLSTPEHPYYTVPTSIRRGKLRVIERRVFGQPEWKSAANIRHESSTVGKISYIPGGAEYSDDNLYAPRINLKPEPWFIQIRESNGKKPGNIRGGQIEVTSRLARLLGIYVAEGWSDPLTSAITFSFGDEEQDLIRFVQTTLFDVFGLNSVVRKFKNRDGVCVTARSRMLAEVLVEFFNGKAVAKKLPDQVFRLAPESRLEFLKGIIDGDGTVVKSRNSVVSAAITTASRTLAEQISYLSLSCVGPTYLQTCTRKSGFVEGSTFYRVVFTKQQLPYLTDLFGDKGVKASRAVEEITTAKQGSSQSFWALDHGFVIAHVKQPEIGKEYDGPVYNIEVEDDHSYVVEGLLAVHNCGVYQIDPAEISFPMSAGSGQQSTMFESKQEERLKASKDKGLRPLLNAITRWINQFIMRRIAPDFYFTFVGMDSKDETEIIDMRIKEVGGYKTLDEVREEAGLKPLGEEKAGDMVLNSTYTQIINQRAMMSQMGQEGGQPGEEGAPPKGGQESDENQAQNGQESGENQPGMMAPEDQGQEPQDWRQYLQPSEQEEGAEKGKKPLKKSMDDEDGKLTTPKLSVDEVQALWDGSRETRQKVVEVVAASPYAHIHIPSDAKWESLSHHMRLMVVHALDELGHHFEHLEKLPNSFDDQRETTENDEKSDEKSQDDVKDAVDHLKGKKTDSSQKNPSEETQKSLASTEKFIRFTIED